MVEYAPTRAANQRQGRIITQNATLLAVLKERSMEKSSVTTLTSSPTLRAASVSDDEKSQFVSPNIDDADPNHTQVTGDSHQLDLVSQESERTLSSDVNQYQAPHIIQPVRTPYDQEYQLEEAEKTELELEVAYQNSLKDRLDKQFRHTERTLDQLSGDFNEQMSGIAADSLDFQRHDSLEEDSDGGLDSGTYRTDQQGGKLEQGRRLSRDSLEVAQLTQNLEDTMNRNEHSSPPASLHHGHQGDSDGTIDVMSHPGKFSDQMKPVGPIVQHSAKLASEWPSDGPMDGRVESQHEMTRQLRREQMTPSNSDETNSPFTMGGQAWGKRGASGDRYKEPDDDQQHELFLQKEQQVYLQQQLQLKQLQLEQLQQQHEQEEQQEQQRQEQMQQLQREQEEQQRQEQMQQQQLQREQEEQQRQEQMQQQQQRPEEQQRQEQQLHQQELHQRQLQQQELYRQQRMQQQPVQQHQQQQQPQPVYRMPGIGQNEGVYGSPVQSNVNGNNMWNKPSGGNQVYYGDNEGAQQGAMAYDPQQFPPSPNSRFWEPHSPRTRKKSLSPSGLDFIQINKEVKKQHSAQSYKKIFANRKVSKKHTSQKPLVARRGEWDQVSSANDSIPSSATSFSEKTSSAEVMWRNRVPSLGQQQPLHKFPSDGHHGPMQGDSEPDQATHGSYLPDRMGQWHPTSWPVDADQRWDGQRSQENYDNTQRVNIDVDLKMFQQGGNHPVGPVMQQQGGQQPVGPIRQQQSTGDYQYHKGPTSQQQQVGMFRPVDSREPMWQRMEPTQGGAVHGYPQAETESVYNGPGKTYPADNQWANAESAAHHRDQYRDQYRDQNRDQYGDQNRDQYRDQNRDQYRDQNRDQYRDQNRDQYRDQNRDQYRDQNRDQYRDQYSYREQVPRGRPQTPIGSPYRVLPPIGLSDTEDSYTGLSAKSSDWGSKASLGGADAGGSYMSHYDKQRRQKVEYKEYTLEDYKKLKKEVKLGGLGPDLENETLKQKRDKIQRQLEYGKEVSEKNRQIRHQESGKSRSHQYQPSYADEGKEIAQCRRTQAMNYAKSVPKPKLPSKTPQGEKSSSKGSRQNHNTGTSATMASFETDLTKLQQRHENDRRQADMIRTTMQQKGVVMSPSQQTLSSEA